MIYIVSGELAWGFFKAKEIFPSTLLGKEIKRYYKIAILIRSIIVVNRIHTDDPTIYKYY